MTRRRTARDHPINLRPWQVVAAVEGRLSVLVVPMRVAPGTTLAHVLWRQNPNGLGSLGDVPLDHLVSPLIVGERYWCREQHAIVPRTAYRMSDGVQQTDSPVDPDMAAIYRAGWERSAPGWRSSTAMPRWASRITIVPTEVRVCRLHDVTEDEADGAVFGGGFPSAVLPHLFPDPDKAGARTIPECFGVVWNDQHGTGAYERNPWCAVARCAVHLRNIDKESEHG